METCIGIDLGTSNSAVAVSQESGKEAEVLEISQLVAPETMGKKKTLPSVLYLAHDSEKAEAIAIGAWARERGAEVPDRVIASAKSWLCNGLVDREAPILPWKSESVENKLSPLEASRLILEHLKSALGPLNEARVVLTVPASFDEVARKLTHQAAEAAGLGKVTLLEEPQAAFYAWIAQQGEGWRKQVRPGDIVLVVDVGGGTTDFSLIAVSDEGGNLRLERISVGEHLLLGGDNMDLALAYELKAQLEAAGHRIDTWQLLGLVHSCRAAKETLLSENAPEEIPISVAGRGSSLFAKTVSAKLKRDLVLDVAYRFFPLTSIEEPPAARRSIGFQEYGLPFVSDPAISKHLARFLIRSLENVRSDAGLSRLVGEQKGSFLQPTAVLFNGGVFNAPALRERVVRLLNQWGGTVRELPGAELDLAVAKGAAQYARTLSDGKGIRIKAGTARSYYLGLESSAPAIPGFQPPIKGLCIVPQGIEEGSDLALPDREFGLVTGEPVEFRFFSSPVRAGDGVGAIIEDAEQALEESSRLKITLPAIEGRAGEVVPVSLDAQVTEVGTLELHMKHTRSDRKWNLEFNVRPE